ncbi:hypothetical protein DM01DRAFT_1295816 [Hesseltinella vesiculosa]|uniref:Uncharacterized protein n=1 Tax=Hesseltinella vesiculosa TaxID=101127 RepID=A0A1X2G3G4_9FUNG|nr:hypothetical protein DM01DRAFT_1295816 [Hesseltinella vesiculosa]
MDDWTSEKIAKAIKGSGYTSDQRIDLALKIWQDPQLFFPNKDGFLFDWLAMALSKPNMKK